MDDVRARLEQLKELLDAGLIRRSTSRARSEALLQAIASQAGYAGEMLGLIDGRW